MPRFRRDSRMQGSCNHSIISSTVEHHLFKAHGSSLGLNLDALDGQTLIISAIKAIRFRC